MLAALAFMRRLTVSPALRYLVVALAFAAHGVLQAGGVIAGGSLALMLAFVGSGVAARRAAAQLRGR